MSIRIRKFDSSSIKESRIIFILGKRNTGKSVLMKDLLYHMPRPDYVVAMAPTEDTLRMYREFLPESSIFNHFSQEKLDKIVSVQRELVNRNKKRTLLIILDDCLYQKGVLKSTSMRSIFFNGRHDNISLICAAQYMMEVDVSLRTNVDYIFSMRENILTNRQKLYKYYFGQFAKFEEFDKVMNACTQDYKALVLDGTVSSTTPTDCVLWYKARVDIPPFRLSKGVFWTFSERYAISMDLVRKEQTKQFAINNAAAECTKKPNIMVVQTEDENGDIIA
jgi:predicted AAA+ superfamily ATPase